ncbi:hypothetical protein FRC17_003392 [Serendipita sp. 399]|nr:hypothetical protein FRC17_003392 [Serendipita sp. 399]
MSKSNTEDWEFLCILSSDASLSIIQVELPRETRVVKLRDYLMAQIKGISHLSPQDVKLYRVDLHYSNKTGLHQTVAAINNGAFTFMEEAQRLHHAFEGGPKGDYIHIVVKVTDTDGGNEGLGRRRRQAEKTWVVSGPIAADLYDKFYIADPASQIENNDIIDHIEKGSMMLVMGPRGSGKTTRLLRLITLLDDQYDVIMVTFEALVHLRDEATFWVHLGRTIKNQYNCGDISSSANFLEAFIGGPSLVRTRKVVLLLDELGALELADRRVVDAFLSTLRVLRDQQAMYKVQSVVSTGTFSLFYLTTTSLALSPFNTTEPLHNPHLDKSQVQQLFKEFATTKNIEITANVVDDIWMKTSGYASLISVCGDAIASELYSPEIVKDNKTVTLTNWIQCLNNKLENVVFSYPSFGRMTLSLLSKVAVDAMALYRLRFAGHSDLVSLTAFREAELANFLVAEGALIRPAIRQPCYRISSPLIDESTPPHLQPPPPRRDNHSLDVKRTLIESLRFFDKELMANAPYRSYKSAKVIVHGVMGTSVPRESVYDTEYMRVLATWFNASYGFAVTGQAHLVEGRSHRYCDIVITGPEKPTVVLELLATGTLADIEEHLKKTPTYGKLLAADEMWVVHLTCEDHYLQSPVWQSDQDLDNGINLIHFAHNTEFNKASWAAKWKDEHGAKHMETGSVF